MKTRQRILGEAGCAGATNWLAAPSDCFQWQWSRTELRSLKLRRRSGVATLMTSCSRCRRWERSWTCRYCWKKERPFYGWKTTCSSNKSGKCRKVRRTSCKTASVVVLHILAYINLNYGDHFQLFRSVGICYGLRGPTIFLIQRELSCTHHFSIM